MPLYGRRVVPYGNASLLVVMRVEVEVMEEVDEVEVEVVKSAQTVDRLHCMSIIYYCRREINHWDKSQ